MEHASRSTKDAVAAILADAKNAVEQVGVGMSGIADATDGQRSSADVVARNVESIAAMARENDALIERWVGEVKRLERLATDLTREVGRFKV